MSLFLIPLGAIPPLNKSQTFTYCLLREHHSKNVLSTLPMVTPLADVPSNCDDEDVRPSAENLTCMERNCRCEPSSILRKLLSHTDNETSEHAIAQAITRGSTIRISYDGAPSFGRSTIRANSCGSPRSTNDASSPSVRSTISAHLPYQVLPLQQPHGDLSSIELLTDFYPFRPAADASTSSARSTHRGDLFSIELLTDFYPFTCCIRQYQQRSIDTPCY
jgi:hypothetical protein